MAYAYSVILYIGHRIRTFGNAFESLLTRIFARILQLEGIGYSQRLCCSALSNPSFKVYLMMDVLPRVERGVTRKGSRQPILQRNNSPEVEVQIFALTPGEAGVHKPLPIISRLS